MTDLTGLTGTITVATQGKAGPGEVQVQTNGGTRCLIAYSDEPLARHTQVAIYDDRGGMRVGVTPTTQ